MARGPRAAVGAAAVGLTATLLCLPGTAHAEDGAWCDPGVQVDTPLVAHTKEKKNPAHERMHVAEAQKVATGRGVTVAVIDSEVRPGVAASKGLWRAPGIGMPQTGHGTIAAGLIAGPQGVAPGASIYSVAVYDATTDDASEGTPVSAFGIADGIRHVLSQADRLDIGVVNISLSVSKSTPQLESAVRDLVARDIVVVASAGNADPDRASNFKGTDNSDANVYPADYPGVLAVSANVPEGADLRDYVLPNRDTDVTAPTYGALSVNLNAQKCVMSEVATSWSAAEVSGVVALLREKFPRENAAQISSRLMATAEGSGLVDEQGNPENNWSGAGSVQAYDALTRAISPGREGKIDRSERQLSADATAPPAPVQVDLLGPARLRLLWAGLLGGTILALAFILRPLLRR